MTGLLGVNIQEGKGKIVFVDFVARDFTLNNLGKNAVGHSYQYNGAGKCTLNFH
jgi:hypothetical protein